MPVSDKLMQNDAAPPVPFECKTPLFECKFETVQDVAKTETGHQTRVRTSEKPFSEALALTWMCLVLATLLPTLVLLLCFTYTKDDGHKIDSFTHT